MTHEIQAIGSGGKNWRPRWPRDQNNLNLNDQLTIGLKDMRGDCEFRGEEDRRTNGPKDKRNRGQ